MNINSKETKKKVEFLYLDEPAKLTINTKEGYPGLYETLQINNNRQSYLKFNDQTMSMRELKYFFSSIVLLST